MMKDRVCFDVLGFVFLLGLGWVGWVGRQSSTDQWEMKSTVIL